jgi:hypothetical protein
MCKGGGSAAGMIPESFKVSTNNEETQLHGATTLDPSDCTRKYKKKGESPSGKKSEKMNTVGNLELKNTKASLREQCKD